MVMIATENDLVIAVIVAIVRIVVTVEDVNVWMVAELLRHCQGLPFSHPPTPTLRPVRRLLHPSFPPSHCREVNQRIRMVVIANGRENVSVSVTIDAVVVVERLEGVLAISPLEMSIMLRPVPKMIVIDVGTVVERIATVATAIHPRDVVDTTMSSNMDRMIIMVRVKEGIHRAEVDVKVPVRAVTGLNKVNFRMMIWVVFLPRQTSIRMKDVSRPWWVSFGTLPIGLCR
jgi:hypothetical protein